MFKEEKKLIKEQQKMVTRFICRSLKEYPDRWSGSGGDLITFGNSHMKMGFNVEFLAPFTRVQVWRIDGGKKGEYSLSLFNGYMIKDAVRKWKKFMKLNSDQNDLNELASCIMRNGSNDIQNDTDK